jgi:large subunit ribosomal protein L9
MQVILREDVGNLGEVGDVVNVKSGYARNFLLPRGLAVVANERQMSRLEHEKGIIEKRVSRLRDDAQGIKNKLEKVSLNIEKACGENGKLFGSVTAMEVEALLRESGFDLDRRKIQLWENLKALGDYDIDIKLHRDVVATVKVSVTSKEEQA